MSKDKSTKADQTMIEDVESLDIQAAIVGLNQKVKELAPSMDPYGLVEACSQIGHGLATVIDRECADGRLDNEVRGLLGEVTTNIVALRNTNFDPAATFLSVGVVTGVVSGMAEKAADILEEDED